MDTTNDTADGTIASTGQLLNDMGADGKISLREAVLAANNTSAAVQIVLPSGTYTLASGAGDNFGDLNW